MCAFSSNIISAGENCLEVLYVPNTGGDASVLNLLRVVAVDVELKGIHLADVRPVILIRLLLYCCFKKCNIL